MKTNIQQFAAALLMVLAATTADARPIVLPDPASTAVQTGTFSVNADNQITLTGSPISLTTSLPTSGDIASGSARYMSGPIKYDDGSTVVDGKMGMVVFGSEIKNGQVIYMLAGLIYGTLTQASSNVNVNGDFSVVTKAAPEGTPLDQAQIDTSRLLVTIRSKISPLQ